jgi:riboflavin kinase/FMN adenylyltransferase
MELFSRDIDSIAIGRFDGFHLGHQQLFSSLLDSGGILVIHRDSDKYILPPQFTDRLINLPIFRYNLSDIKELQGKEFISKLFSDFPNLKKIVVGYDFFFGNGRDCSAKDLQKSSNCEVEIIDEVMIEGISVHSGKIIELLQTGNIEIANRLLGREYQIIGTHIHEQRIGGEKLVPTINLQYRNFISPKEGIYLSTTILDSREFNSVSFIGDRKTTDDKFALETHILDSEFRGGEFNEVTVKFKKFIRANIKFDTLADLKVAIEKDIEVAKSYI